VSWWSDRSGQEGFLLSGALEPAHFPNSSEKILDRGGNSYPECGKRSDDADEFCAEQSTDARQELRAASSKLQRLARHCPTNIHLLV
jgi:hypothetical protein